MHIGHSIRVPSVLGGGFLPTDIAGCKVWLRADLGVTLNGGTVSAWANQADATTLVSVVQAVTPNQPTYRASGINGLPDLDFDGGDWLANPYLAGDLSQPLHIFVVCETDVGALMWALGAVDPAKRIEMYFHTPSGGVQYIYGGASLLGTSFSTGVPILREAVFDGASSQIWTNGTLNATGNAGANVMGGLVVGDTQPPLLPFDGPIAEVIVYT